MAVYTDLADELYGRDTRDGRVPLGVRVASGTQGNVRVTRVEVLASNLERPRGRYITMETPNLSVLDERDEGLIETAALQLQSLLPPEGTVLVVGVGNRRVTADALGPRTAQRILVTRGRAHSLRPVCAVAPGVSGATGISLQGMVRALVESVKPAAVICVDSLCSGEAARLGRTIQFSDAGLCPKSAGEERCLTCAHVGVPVVAAGIPTMMQAEELCGAAGLIVTPRELDSVIRQGSALLAGAINRALQPGFSVAELSYLVS